MRIYDSIPYSLVLSVASVAENHWRRLLPTWRLGLDFKGESFWSMRQGYNYLCVLPSPATLAFLQLFRNHEWEPHRIGLF